MKVYIDSDGVLADFEGWVRKYDPELLHPVYKTAIKHILEAFKKSEVIDKGLIEFIKNNKDAYVLTAVPSIEHIDSYNDTDYSSEALQNIFIHNKKSWFESVGIPLEQVIIVTHREDKVKYSNPGTLLIDDYEKNCEEWRKHGGTAVHYTREK